jgi:hypothetical protein
MAYVRTTGAAVFGLAAPTAIGLSTSNESHHPVSYLIWYCLAGLGLATAIVATVVIDRGNAGGNAAEPPLASFQGPLSPSGGVPDPCEERLRDLAKGGHQLAHILGYFDNWWPAVQDEDFNGKLPDDFGPVTHADAKETLLFMFGQFFSAAWTFQSFCRTHPDRAEVKKWVDQLYDALGARLENPGDLPDARVPSTKLHEIGKLCTRGWGTADGHPVHEGSDFKGILEYHPDAFKLLWAFLRTAEPGSLAHARVEAAEKAARNVEENLAEKDYVP